MRQSNRIIKQCVDWLRANPGPGDHRQPQGRAAVARGDEGQHGRADPPLQALHRRLPRARRARPMPRSSTRRASSASTSCRDGANKPYRLKIRAAGLRAPGRAGRDGARPHDRRRGGDHRHAWTSCSGRSTDESDATQIDRCGAAVRERRCADAFDSEVAKYPPDQKQSAVMACLAIVQQEQGWLSAESDERRRRLPRHAADRGPRGHDLLHHVQPAAGRASFKLTSAPTCRARCATAPAALRRT